MFAPAVMLMNRLTYPKKFLLVGAVVVAVIALLITELFVHLNDGITAAEKERLGVSYIKPLRTVIDATQKHRGLAAGFLNGDTSVKDRMLDQQRLMDEAIKAADVVDAKVGKALDTSAKWSALKGKWNDLKGRVTTLTPKESFGQHTALIGEILDLINHVGDTSALYFDPDVDSYYLMDAVINNIPLMIERQGQLRAFGSSVLAKRQLDTDAKGQMIAMVTLVSDRESTARGEIAKSMRANATVGKKLGDATKGMETAVAELASLVKTKILSETFDLTTKEYFDRATASINASYKVIDIGLDELDELLGLRIERDRRNLLTALGAGLAGLLVVAYLFIGMYRSASQAIDALAKQASVIAGGDLTARVDLETKDELTQVADSFNAMADGFNSLIRGVQQSSHELSAAARQLTETSSQVATGSEQQSEAASAMAATVEEMTVGIQQISDHAHEVQGVSRESGELSARGEEVIVHTAEEMTKIAATVRDSAAVIETLGEQSAKISGIVNVINEIAEQTNLLALNAAIEAARAGEQGRGFAVVADEVRKLAERTASSTREIATMIGQIQDGTRRAVASMETGVSQVDEGAKLAAEAGVSITRIKAGAAQASSMVDGISDAIREQSVASNDIARHVEKIAQMAEENNAAVQQTAEAAHHLNQLAGSLQGAISRFRV